MYAEPVDQSWKLVKWKKLVTKHRTGYGYFPVEWPYAEMQSLRWGADRVQAAGRGGHGRTGDGY